MAWGAMASASRLLMCGSAHKGKMDGMGCLAAVLVEPSGAAGWFDGGLGVRMSF